jgi:hypothetical protein
MSEINHFKNFILCSGDVRREGGRDCPIHMTCHPFHSSTSTTKYEPMWDFGLCTSVEELSAHKKNYLGRFLFFCQILAELSANRPNSAQTSPISSIFDKIAPVCFNLRSNIRAPM